MKEFPRLNSVEISDEVYMKKCYIFGAGSNYGDKPKICKDDFVIAADGGYRYTEMLGVTPDIVVGDFDSLGEAPNFPNVIKLKPEKDETDLAEAIAIGISNGCNDFHIFGGVGGKRSDHTLANIQLLAHLSKQNLMCRLYGENEIFTAITDSSMTFSAQMRGYISVFAHDNKCTGVNLKGLKYELDNYTLTNDVALGVSNEFMGTESSVSVKKGTLIIIYPKGII